VERVLVTALLRLVRRVLALALPRRVCRVLALALLAQVRSPLQVFRLLFRPRLLLPLLLARRRRLPLRPRHRVRRLLSARLNPRLRLLG
jgi:hypothetical protein